ncbi:MAG: hypothetical protein IT432_13855 [Phycisphaerales bacterium]|nr:hypothetical protein [Phycisphaerales bacterium]
MPPHQPQREEPSNGDLARMIQGNHEETTRKLTEAGERLSVLEHHLVNPTCPEETLPIRMRDIESKVRSIDKKHEKLSRTAAGLIVAFIGALVTSAGAWIWRQIEGGARSSATDRADRN